MNKNSINNAILSGFASLDRITGGLHPSELVVLTGLPTMGKTALALDIAYNATINSNIPVAFFSMEIPHSFIQKRLLLSMSGKYGASSQLLNRLAHTLYIDDTPSLKIPDFRSKAEYLIEQKNVRLLIIDYLQLFQSPCTVQLYAEHIDIVLQSLKNIAVETGVPIIVCAQLSRFDNRRIGDNWPKLSELCDYDLFRKNSDSLILIHRRLSHVSGDSNETKVIVGKFRDEDVIDIQEANLMFQKNSIGVSDV